MARRGRSQSLDQSAMDNGDGRVLGEVDLELVLVSESIRFLTKNSLHH